MLYDIIFLEPSTFFYVIGDHVTVMLLGDWCIIPNHVIDCLQQCDNNIILTITLSPRNREINEK